jgi:hypothetical protein
MEVNNVTSKAYTSAAAATTEDEELQEEQQQVQEYGVAKPQKEENDTVELTETDYDEADVEEKANNYLQNILFFGNLTEESATLIQNYINTFDVEAFIDFYGPFSSTAEISAAMYAATSGMVKQEEA